MLDEKCDNKCDNGEYGVLEKAVAGFICRRCALYYDQDGKLAFEITAPTVGKIERLINGYKED